MYIVHHVFVDKQKRTYTNNDHTRLQNYMQIVYVYSQSTYTYTLLHVYKQAHICVCAHVYAHTVKY